MKKKICVFIFLILLKISVFSQKIFFEDNTYKKNIKTVQLYKNGWQLAPPIIKLLGDGKIKLSFDDLSSDTKDYSYTFIHCNSDWESSELMTFDYLDGFEENQISDFEFSTNTFQTYIHYNLIFPNEDIKFKISGNYILMVYEDFEKNNVVLTRRFSIVEHLVEIKTDVHRPQNLNFFDNGQEIDFIIETSSFPIRNPFNDLKVIVTQNGRWDNSKKNLEPKFIKDNELIYNFEKENIFLGGNEFRFFDIKTFDFESEGVEKIFFTDSIYRVLIENGKSRNFDDYRYYKDFNGKFFIDLRRSMSEIEISADYAYIFFNFPYEIPFLDGDIYVFGGLTNWKINKENKMIYNFEKKSYQLKLYLKQGLYNFSYVFASKKGQEIKENFFEGNNYETENDYIIYVFLSRPGDNYERLIALNFSNSLKKL